MTAGRQGISLIELLVALAVFFSAATALSDLLITSVDAYGHGVKVASLDGEARRALDRMADELISASTLTFVPPPVLPFGTSTITFQKAQGIVAGVMQWSPPSRFELAPSPSEPWDGVDNDEDGFVDEAD